jgi:hypothetical protein
MEFLKSLKRLLIATYSATDRFALVLFIASQPEYKGTRVYSAAETRSSEMLPMLRENFQ